MPGGGPWPEGTTNPTPPPHYRAPGAATGVGGLDAPAAQPNSGVVTIGGSLTVDNTPGAGGGIMGSDNLPISHTREADGKINWSANTTNDTKIIGEAMLKTSLEKSF